MYLTQGHNIKEGGTVNLLRSVLKNSYYFFFTNLQLKIKSIQHIKNQKDYLACFVTNSLVLCLLPQQSTF